MENKSELEFMITINIGKLISLTNMKLKIITV